jgi:hypothetical protein
LIEQQGRTETALSIAESGYQHLILTSEITKSNESEIRSLLNVSNNGGLQRTAFNPKNADDNPVLGPFTLGTGCP